MAGSVHIPWYATGFRHDGLAEALAEIAPVAARYGATGWSVYRGIDDRYKFLQIADFERKIDFAKYWDGPEFIHFRAVHSSWYTVPVLYAWQDKLVVGAVNANGNGHVSADEPAEAPEEADLV